MSSQISDPTHAYDKRTAGILSAFASITSWPKPSLGRPKNGNDMMNGYYRPQEILVMEAELARAKAMLAAQGVAPDLLDVNTPLLAELVIKARTQANATSQPGRDVASVAASQFSRTMLGLEAADKADFPSGRDLTAA